jgi:hypothetical protein
MPIDERDSIPASAALDAAHRSGFQHRLAPY